jgi:hypothetical protein
VTRLSRDAIDARRRIEVPVLLKAKLRDEHARLEAQMLADLEQERKDPSLAGPDRPASADALAEFEKRIEAEQRVFVIESMGYQEWLRLKIKYGPTDEHAALGFDYDPERFPVAALAASCVDPELPLGLDDDEAAEAEAEGYVTAWHLFEEVDESVQNKLWGAVLEVNLGNAALPKSLPLAVLAATRNGGSSGTPLNGESRRPDSSDADASQ